LLLLDDKTNGFGDRNTFLTDQSAPGYSANGTRGRELAIVIPTFNERDNILPMLELLDVALLDIAWEVIFVDDDSPDGTAALVRDIAQNRLNVRVVERIGRRGLSSAVVEGILASSAKYVAVMDCDMQHDERLLPQMLALLKTGQYDIVVGSRYTEGGSVGKWDKKRKWMSEIATKFSKFVIADELTDPMSGFFMMRRGAFESSVRQLSAQGYKILLDILASSPKRQRISELPFTFRIRQHGESKIDSLVLLEYGFLLIDKFTGGYVPARFVLFSIVGLSGVFVHFMMLLATYKTNLLTFEVAQGVATMTAMTTNFMFNNTLTYRDKRLRGTKFLTGLLSFYAVCTVGIVGNVGIARYLFLNAYGWWLAAIAGILVGSVWNYAASAAVTWRKK
jgi:dolichol-phosphate mannosyltransferase